MRDRSRKTAGPCIRPKPGRFRSGFADQAGGGGLMGMMVRIVLGIVVVSGDYKNAYE